MSQRQHRIAIRKGLPTINRLPRVVAVCTTCGWEGRPQESEIAAEIDGDGHVIAVPSS